VATGTGFLILILHIDS